MDIITLNHISISVTTTVNIHRLIFWISHNLTTFFRLYKIDISLIYSSITIDTSVDIVCYASYIYT